MDARTVIEEIMAVALKVTLERERLRVIFMKSGIGLDADMRVTVVTGDAMTALKTLMKNLSELAVVKISAKQVVRRAGMTL